MKDVRFPKMRKRPTQHMFLERQGEKGLRSKRLVTTPNLSLKNTLTTNEERINGEKND